MKRFALRLLLIIGSVASAASGQTPPPDHPNIVVIVADDLGYGDVSFNGCPDYATPNIDSLAANGIWFSNGYVTHPFCSPSRAALMTGRYQQRFGYENQPGDDRSNPRQGLPMNELTLAEILKAVGYASGVIGKWHLGTAPNKLPPQRGFDEYFGFSATGSQYYNASIDQNGTIIKEPAYLTDAFTREGVSFINRHSAEPFFLYLAYNAVHTPYQTPPQNYMDRVANITDPDRQLYAAMVTALDDGIGQVLQALRAQNLLDKTLVFFLSDNGAPFETFTRNLPLRGSKGTMWEGGIHVPFAIQWTGRIPPNRIYDQPISSLDIVPTVAAAVNVSLPTDRDYDGLNVMPFLTGEQAGPQRTLFWRWFGLGKDGPTGSRNTIYAVRSSSLKLLMQNFASPALYNLSTDIGETQNLASAQPVDLASLKRLYADWQTELIAPLWQEPKRTVNAMVLAGDWNAFNKNDTSSPWRLTRITAPAVQGSPDGTEWFVNTIRVAEAAGDTRPGIHSFVIAAANDPSPGQWGGAIMNIDDVTSIPFFSGGALAPSNSISLLDGFYYSFRIIEWVYNANMTLSVMKTSAQPVSVSVTNQTPTVPTADDPVAVSVITSQPKSTEERIYLRWSTDFFVTSHMVEAVGSGVNYSATIPPQPAGTAVQYCITTSTADLSQVTTSGRIDTLTLSTSVNSKYVVNAASPTPTPTPTPTATPALSGLTYNGGIAFVDGTNLTQATRYTVTAQANNITRSVVFRRDGVAVKTDSASPFDFTWTPGSLGTHTLVATPWSSTGGAGSSGPSITVSFKIAAISPTPTPTPTPTATPALSGLTYNGGIAFVDGTNLTQATRYTVTAQANNITRSVVFRRDGVAVKTDSASPFDFTWTPGSLGTHTLVATPWSSTGGAGSSGPSITVSFKIAAISPPPTPTSTPTPRPTDVP